MKGYLITSTFLYFLTMKGMCYFHVLSSKQQEVAGCQHFMHPQAPRPYPDPRAPGSNVLGP